MALTTDEQSALRELGKRWEMVEDEREERYPNARLREAEIDISPGETKTFFESGEAGRILGFEVSPPTELESTLRTLDLKITWDGEAQPAVYLPAADYFGYAFGRQSMRAWLLGSDERKCYSYLPMPFDRSARMELVYRADGEDSLPLHLRTRVWYSDQARNEESEGKFYAFWNRETQAGRPHTILSVEGKGHHIATLLQAQGLRAGMTYFFEGDDSTVIDGEMRIHGTGSEDYFNGGWYALMDRWDGAMSLPLHGALDYSLPFCRTGGFRFFLTDKLSFRRSLHHTIEHGPTGNRFPVEYTSVALYYSDRAPQEVVMPTTDKTRVFIPDTLFLYPQLMTYNLAEGISINTTWKYGTGGQSYQFIPSDDLWVRISLEEIPEGNYQLFADVVSMPTGCEFSVWHRQTQISQWYSTYSQEEKRISELQIGSLTVNPTRNTITLRFRVKRPGDGLMLNRLKFVRIRQ